MAGTLRAVMEETVVEGDKVHVTVSGTPQEVMSPTADALAVLAAKKAAGSDYGLSSSTSPYDPKIVKPQDNRAGVTSHDEWVAMSSPAGDPKKPSEKIVHRRYTLTRTL